MNLTDAQLVWIVLLAATAILLLTGWFWLAERGMKLEPNPFDRRSVRALGACVVLSIAGAILGGSAGLVLFKVGFISALGIVIALCKRKPK